MGEPGQPSEVMTLAEPESTVGEDREVRDVVKSVEYPQVN